MEEKQIFDTKFVDMTISGGFSAFTADASIGLQDGSVGFELIGEILSGEFSLDLEILDYNFSIDLEGII